MNKLGIKKIDEIVDRKKEIQVKIKNIHIDVDYKTTYEIKDGYIVFKEQLEDVKEDTFSKFKIGHGKSGDELEYIREGGIKSRIIFLDNCRCYGKWFNDMLGIELDLRADVKEMKIESNLISIRYESYVEGQSDGEVNLEIKFLSLL